MARPKSDVYQRFLSKVKMVESGCHEWTHAANRGGYGTFQYGNKKAAAHRVAFALFKHPIDSSQHVMHSCDNRLCVNPEHLSIGTPKDNVVDMDRKGRRGTKSKLNYAQVEEIRALLANRYSQQEIAKRYGVCQTVISRIKLRRTKLFLE